MVAQHTPGYALVAFAQGLWLNLHKDVVPESMHVFIPQGRTENIPLLGVIEHNLKGEWIPSNSPFLG